MLVKLQVKIGKIISINFLEFIISSDNWKTFHKQKKMIYYFLELITKYFIKNRI